MNHEKMAGRTQLSARSKRGWRSHRQYHHCIRISLVVVSVLCVHIASPCLLPFWFFGYVRSLFVLDAPRAGRASGGGVLHRSIGIEPPRLPCGRAANYGSIIVPNTCRRLHREQPGFYRVSCIARSFLRSWRTHESGSGVQPIALGMCLMPGYSVFKVR